MSRRARIVAAMATGLAASVAVFALQAQAEDPTAQKLREGLESFGATADQLVDDPMLQEAMALTGLDPASGLDLGDLFGDVFDAVPMSAGSVDAFVDLLNHDDRDTTYGDVDVVLGCESGETPPGECQEVASTTSTAGVIDLTIPFRASRTTNVPLSLDTDLVDLGGGALEATLTLDTTLHFRFDPAEPEAALAFSLVTPSSIAVVVDVDDASPIGFTANVGFTEATVGGSITTAGLDLTVVLNDPDSSGQITRDEWTTTALADLVTVTKGGSVDASLTVDSPLTTAAPDVTIPVADSDLSNGFGPITSPSLGRLADFGNVSPEQVVAGLAELANGLQGLKNAGNPTLPFLQDGVGKNLDIAGPVLSLVDRFSVVCGTTTGNPPTGNVSQLAAGTTVYCQARVSQDPTGDVTWTIGNGTPTSITDPTGGTASVGTTPNAAISFTMAEAGTPEVSATYPVGSETKTVARAPATAQELFEQLADIAGFQEDIPSVDEVQYQESTRALTFRLRRTFNPGPTPPMPSDPADPNRERATSFDFGDQLKSVTKIAGLNPSGNATVTLDAGQVTLDLTFGVILVPNVADIDPADNGDPLLPPGEVDRFFLQVNPTDPELAYDDATVAVSNFGLAGKVGYLEVTAEGAADAPTAEGQVFRVAKQTGADKLLTVQVAGPGIPVTVGGSPQTIANATTVRDLLNDLPGQVSADLNAQFNAGLEVSATLSGTEIATGKVGVNWDDVTVGLPTVTADADFTGELLPFDTIDPTNPQALLSLILDNLDALVDAVDDAGGSFDTPIPLVGATPRDVLGQIDRLRSAADEIRGESAADIVCGTNNTNPPTMPAGQSIDALVFSGAPVTVYCQAVGPKASTAVQWSASGTGTGAAATPNDTSTSSVGPSPTQNFAFTLLNNQLASEENATGWKVNLTFTDEDGEHDLDLPDNSVPTTLQKLEDVVEDKLGIPENALAFELKDFSGTKNLVVRLNFSRCTTGTTGNTAIATCNTATDKTVPKLSVPVAFDLGSTGGLVGVGSNASVDLEYIARAKLNLAVPLTASPTPSVLTSSGVELQAGLSSDTLDLTANIGPLELKLGTAVDTDSTTGGVQAGTGKGRLRAGFSLGSPTATPATTTAESSQSIATFASGISASFADPATDPSGCGDVDPDEDPGTDNSETLEGPGCAKLALGLNDTYLGDLGIRVNSLAPFDADVYTPEDLETAILNALLDWDMLLQALPELLEKLEASLDGTASDVKVPLLGDALDGGADVVNRIRTNVVEPVSNLAATVASAGDADGDGDADPDALDVQEAIQEALFVPLDAAGLLQPGDNNDEIGVTLVCGGVPCADGDDPDTIDDARVTFTIGQGDAPTAVGCTNPAPGACVDGAAIPFDIGLDGLPVRLTGALTPKVGWRANLDFGLDRDGPYLVTGGPGHQAGPEVTVGASVSLGDSPTPCPAQNLSTSGLAGFSTTRCLQGTLGFLGVTVWDGADASPTSDRDDRSNIGVLAALDLTGPNRIPLLNLPSQLGADLDFEGGVNIDTLIRTGLKSDETAGLPSVLGTFHLNATWAAGSSPSAPTPTIQFGDLYLDAGEFIGQFLDPIADEIKNITSPLKPFVDTLQAEVPVVSDLAKLVGADPVTLISLMEVATGSDLDVIRSLIAFLDFVNNLPSDAGLIPLGTGGNGGSFGIDGTKAKAGPQTPDKAGSIIDTGGPGYSAGGNLISQITDNNKAAPAMTTDRPHTFGVPGLSFPFMDDRDDRSAATKVFNILMGQDETLVRYDLGSMRATAGFSYSFGPFFIGPVPVTANIGGSATIEGRFAMGYDTSGLRKVLEGGSGEHLFDGIFLDDLNAAGMDVPEVSLIGEVYAGASVNILIFEAGIEGGIRLTVDLNLNDSPDPDGKLRIEEIFNKLNNPICLFDVSGRMDLFLRFFLEIDLFLYSERVEFEILNITLLDFSLACSPPNPVLAEKTGGVLTLNMGPEARREARQINIDEIDEKFVVRKVSTGRYSVAAFGVYQEFGTATDPVTSISVSGDDGDDVISLLPGASNTVTPPATGQTNSTVSAPTALPFDLPATISGGEGNDAINTGDGDDTVSGNGGDDKIILGAGDDLASGGTGNDQIEGGLGNDTRGLNGGGDNDTVNGGPGGDTITGGSGNDVLNGGPAGDPAAAGPPDEADTIVGNNGNDTISGNDGNDFLHGDDNLGTDVLAACASASGPTVTDTARHTDQIQGGPGNDTITGGPDTDQLIGAEHDDFICGNAGNDKLEGDSPSPGNDFLDGGPDNDLIDGFAGDDILRGQAGNDSLDGGDGHDDLVGGIGRDLLDGGVGQDIALGDDGTVDDHVSIADHQSALHTGPRADVLAAVTVGSTTGTDSLWDCDAYSQTDTTTGNSDCVRGGPDADYLFGEGGGDTMYGDDGTDYMEGNNDDDTMRGGLLTDTMYGNAGDDTMFGDSGADEMFGNDDDDTMRGGIGTDYMEGNASTDTMYGDAGVDRMIGGSTPSDADDEGDTMYGNGGDDVMIGDNGVIATDGMVTPPTGTDPDTFGDDTMHGNDGYDRMFGELGGDTMLGGAGTDYMLGDRGVVTPSTVLPAVWPGGAPNNSVVLYVPAEGGQDTMHGNGADDHMYGGWENDTMEGGPADDYMEGNDGRDRMFGLADTPTAAELLEAGPAPAGSGDEDDMLGGTSTPVSPNPRLDDGELEMEGNLEQDVMTGDNADITRMIDPEDSTLWAIDPITGGAFRTVALLDREKTGAALDAVSGGDTMLGNEHNDRMYGEGGDDCMKGNGEDDYLEGNQDSDFMEGNGGEDDLIGGSSFETPAPGSGVGDPDAADDVYGGGGADFLMGDNAIVTRDPAVPGGPYDYDTVTYNWLPPTAERYMRFLDKGPLDTTKFGGDTLSAGSGADVAFGQDGDDRVFGGTEDDYTEGNGGADTLWGDANAVPDAAETCDSPEPELHGTPGSAGQDDQIGGSSLVVSTDGSGNLGGHRDAGDEIHGNGNADFQLGDNGRILRRLAGGVWKEYFPETGRHTFVRQAAFQADPETRLPARYDVGSEPTANVVWGNDLIYGDDGDDYQFGQDGGDDVYGGNDDDDQYGELGNDRIFGESGQDAQVGDRGLIIDHLEDGTRRIEFDTQGPGFFHYVGLVAGQYDRRVTLTDDGDGAPMPFLGIDTGGHDQQRGGPGHDSMHGAYGDDLMNGDSGGDWLFGDDGADVMWGGKGADPSSPGGEDTPTASEGLSTDPNVRGDNDRFVDYLFGGHGGPDDLPGNKDKAAEVLAADILDFLPRSPAPGFSGDPDIWFTMTNTVKGAPDGNPGDDQYHQGIDWIYGGFNRDVLEADVGKNGPDFGDRLMDWTGAYNLYTRCNASYGDDGDIRQHSPAMQELLLRMAFGSGAGLTANEVRTAGTSAYRELALVYPGDPENNGPAFPTTPGHFEDITCTPGAPPA
jgi:Ca2+-binding RTX toxin-like protein